MVISWVSSWCSGSFRSNEFLPYYFLKAAYQLPAPANHWPDQAQRYKLYRFPIGLNFVSLFVSPTAPQKLIQTVSLTSRQSKQEYKIYPSYLQLLNVSECNLLIWSPAHSWIDDKQMKIQLEQPVIYLPVFCFSLSRQSVQRDIQFIARQIVGLVVSYAAYSYQ